MTASDHLGQQFPESLKSRLLSIGGSEVVERPEDDADKLQERGREFSTRKVTNMPGAPSQCHANVAALTEANPHVGVVTGWALSDDDRWRQHSWGHNAKHGVVETTDEPRKKYFGVKLHKKEAEQFRWDNQ